jgi:opacity protein-like surface antigen
VWLWLLGVPAAANAQETRGIVWEIGASLSAARTTTGGAAVEASVADRLPSMGLAAGVFARLELARWKGVGLGVQPELLHAPRGTGIEIDGAYAGDLRYRYLELPMLARLESPPLGPAAFYAVVGPSLGFLLRAESGTNLGTVSDVKDVTSTLDLGLAAGAGAVVVITPRLALSVEARYTHGFRTLDNTGEFEVENRAIFATVGLAARFGAGATTSREP